MIHTAGTLGRNLTSERCNVPSTALEPSRDAEFSSLPGYRKIANSMCAAAANTCPAPTEYEHPAGRWPVETCRWPQDGCLARIGRIRSGDVSMPTACSADREPTNRHTRSMSSTGAGKAAAAGPKNIHRPPSKTEQVVARSTSNDAPQEQDCSESQGRCTQERECRHPAGMQLHSWINVAILASVGQ